MPKYWEDFKGGPFRQKGSEKNVMSVSLKRTHQIRLNKVVMRELGDPKAVMLRFIRKDGIIGLLPVDIRHEGAFPIKHNRATPSIFTINAASFCQNFGIR